MFGKDDVDYGELKEQRRVEREDVRQIEQSFKLGIGNNLDKMLAVVTGQYKPPKLPGEPDKITKPIKEGVTSASANPAPSQVMQVHVPVEKLASQTQYKYGEVLTELERFPFSNDPKKRHSQLQTVTSAVRQALQDLVIKEVAGNTKAAFTDHVSEVFKVGGGIKVVFDFGEQRIAVTAKGPFYGDETVCCYRKDNNIVGSVIRLDASQEMDDISQNFDITVGKA